jgi:hypothetical protein
MKQLLFIILLLSIKLTGISQGNKKTKEITVTKEKIETIKKTDGSHLVSTSDGIKLFAAVKKGNIQQFTATDVSGKTLEVTARKTGIDCYACVGNDKGDLVCWKIPCSDLPRPPDIR